MRFTASSYGRWIEIDPTTHDAPPGHTFSRWICKSNSYEETSRLFVFGRRAKNLYAWCERFEEESIRKVKWYNEQRERTITSNGCKEEIEWNVKTVILKSKCTNRLSLTFSLWLVWGLALMGLEGLVGVS